MATRVASSRRLRSAAAESSNPPMSSSTMRHGHVPPEAATAPSIFSVEPLPGASLTSRHKALRDSCVPRLTTLRQKLTRTKKASAQQQWIPIITSLIAFLHGSGPPITAASMAFVEGALSKLLVVFINECERVTGKKKKMDMAMASMGQPVAKRQRTSSIASDASVEDEDAASALAMLSRFSMRSPLGGEAAGQGQGQLSAGAGTGADIVASSLQQHASPSPSLRPATAAASPGAMETII